MDCISKLTVAVANRREPVPGWVTLRTGTTTRSRLNRPGGPAQPARKCRGSTARKSVAVTSRKPVTDRTVSLAMVVAPFVFLEMNVTVPAPATKISRIDFVVVNSPVRMYRASPFGSAKTARAPVFRKLEA